MEGNKEIADRLNTALAPLFDLVTVKSKENTPYGDVECRARNPLAIKTLMAILGLPGGPCRQPLGKMTKNGLNKVLAAARSVQEKNPEIFQPAAEYFGIDVEERLSSETVLQGLFYENAY
jgi:4-hydroxy-tetrahydrodipicolinate synthase